MVPRARRSAVCVRGATDRAPKRCSPGKRDIRLRWITPEERRTAITAAKAMGLNVAGVDLLRSSRGPLVMEVNSSPGLEGIENATGKNVAGMIVSWIEKNQQPWKTRTKGRG